MTLCYRVRACAINQHKNTTRKLQEKGATENAGPQNDVLNRTAEKSRTKSF